jgi:mono/diheme cytochrome c family protein
LTPLVKAILKIFYNARTALAIPEKLPPPVPTIPGPGRTDAFGVLAAVLFGTPAKMDAPVKYGFAWNLADRRWVHWDGNMDQPIARNLGASLGLGAPFEGQGKLVDFSLVQRQTDVSERIRAPRFPWVVDSAAAGRGLKTYTAHCASCHDVTEDRRLVPLSEVKTDPNRATLFTAAQARFHNDWLASLKVEGYAAKANTYRSTGGYWANEMSGVWARSPYLHNGSVRTMKELLTPASKRAKSFRVGSRAYDPGDLGFADDGAFLLDTSVSGNSNAGHEYGTSLSDAEKRDLIEYLKTR